MRHKISESALLQRIARRLARDGEMHITKNRPPFGGLGQYLLRDTGVKRTVLVPIKNLNYLVKFARELGVLRRNEDVEGGDERRAKSNRPAPRLWESLTRRLCEALPVTRSDARLDAARSFGEHGVDPTALLSARLRNGRARHHPLQHANCRHVTRTIF